MKFRRYILLCLSLLLILCLSGCKKEPKRPENFGNLEQTETSKSDKKWFWEKGEDTISDSDESSLESQLKESDSELSSTENPFSIINDDGASNIGKSKEEIEESKISQEIESVEENYHFVDMEGQEYDIRDVCGYSGLLDFIIDYGGREKVISDFTKSEFDDFIGLTFFEINDENKSIVLNGLYGNSGHMYVLDEQLKVREMERKGWIYTDNGWKDPYAETASGNGIYLKD